MLFSSKILQKFQKSNIGHRTKFFKIWFARICEDFKIARGSSFETDYWLEILAKFPDFDKLPLAYTSGFCQLNLAVLSDKYVKNFGMNISASVISTLFYDTIQSCSTEQK